MSTEVLQPPKLSVARLLLLGASSVVLCLSNLMTLFTPFPVAMSLVLYGRLKTYLVVILGAAICAYVSPVVLFSYVALAILAVTLTEGIQREWNPIKVSLGIGSFIILGMTLGLIYFSQVEKISFNDLLVTQITETTEYLKKVGAYDDNFAQLGLGTTPKELASEIIKVFPGYFIITIFFILWVNAYLILKARRLLQPAQIHAYDETKLLSFKVPFIGAYAVAIALALSVWGNELHPYGELIGTTLLRAVGVFYFFQGLGVGLGALNYLKVFGFFRTLFVMGIVFFVPWAIVLLGLFDTFFDFDKKFKKKVSN